MNLQEIPEVRTKGRPDPDMGVSENGGAPLRTLGGYRAYKELVGISHRKFIELLVGNTHMSKESSCTRAVEIQLRTRAWSFIRSLMTRSGSIDTPNKIINT